jgi:hypothetical protein
VLIDRLRVQNGNGTEVFRLDGTVRNVNVTVFMEQRYIPETRSILRKFSEYKEKKNKQ